MEKFNRMQQIKRRLFAMRNGVVADPLRRALPAYAMVFGLNLPQIAEIAAGLGHDRGLAEELWADRRTRESLLLAPMVYPLSELTRSRAAAMMRECLTPEVADILCHRLLRHRPDALDLAVDAVAAADPMERYAGLRLMFNLLNMQGRALAPQLRPFAEAELGAGDPATRQIAAALVDEIDFLAGE